MGDILNISGLSVNLNGIDVLNGINMSIRKGDIHFIIGKQGAGKTALFETICGKSRPASGKILFKDEVDISGQSESDISALGIYRKRRTPDVFPGITIFENMEMAAMKKKSLYSTIFKKLSREQIERIGYILESAGLYEVRYRTPAALTKGEQHWLDMSRLLVHSPELILADGFFEDMTKEEIDKTGKLLKRFSKECSMVIAERNMEFVKYYVNKVTVFHKGELVEQGGVEEILNSSEVKKILN